MAIRSHLLIYRYVGREYILSFLVGFAFFFFVFFVNQILLMAEDVLARSVPIPTTIELIVYALPGVVALSFPFGSLVGATMTVARLASDRETIALQASGIAPGRIFIPILVLGAAFSGGSFVMNDYFLPLGTVNYNRVYIDLIYSNPELELEPYTVKKYENRVIVTGDVEDGLFRDLMIVDTDERGNRRVIMAQEAVLVDPGNDANRILLRLTGVEGHSPQDAGEEALLFDAREVDYEIRLRDIIYSIQNPGPREMSSVDLYATIEERRNVVDARRDEHHSATARDAYAFLQGYHSVLGARSAAVVSDYSSVEALRAELNRRWDRSFDDRVLQLYEIEFHKKLAIPAACLVFAMFAFPAGLGAKRSGRAVGFGIGIASAVIFWAMLIGGQALGMERLDIPAFLTMWAPNILFFGLSLVLLVVRVRQ